MKKIVEVVVVNWTRWERQKHWGTTQMERRVEDMVGVLHELGLQTQQRGNLDFQYSILLGCNCIVCVPV